MCSRLFCGVVNNLRVEYKHKQPVLLFHSVFKMQDLSGACFNANKHAMFLVSLALNKRDFFCAENDAVCL